MPTASDSAVCDGTSATKLMSNSVLKWNTTGLTKVRVAVLRSGVRKLAPIETATNNNATSAAEAVPSSVYQAQCWGEPEGRQMWSVVMIGAPLIGASATSVLVVIG